MDYDILKQLFIELFKVNNLMLDLISYFEDVNYDEANDTTKAGIEYSYSMLNNFYLEHFREEFTKEELLEYKENTPYSCLNDLDETETENFLNDLFLIN